MLPAASPLPSRSSRRMRDLLSGKEDQNANATKAQERARRALDAAKTGRRGDIPNPSRMNVILERAGRGTSAARIRKHRQLTNRGFVDEEEDEELDKSAAEAELGIASPLPRSLIRPVAAAKLKKIHGLDGEISDFKE